MKRWVLAGMMAVGIFALASCGENPGAGEEETSLEVSPSPGSLAPDFRLRTVSGKTVRLSNLRGQPVMINFWATWCGPCRFEMPHIQERYERYAGDLVVLLVDNNESAETVAAFMDEMGLTMDSLLDPGAKVQNLYQIRGYPSTFFIDEEGVIQTLHIGIMSEKQMDGYLAELGLDGATAGE